MPNWYLVTGCAGFIGSKLTEMLLASGHEVVGVDNLDSAYDPRLKRWRLGGLANHPSFQFWEVDIADFDRAETLVKNREKAGSPPCSAVVHLAARVGVRASVIDPWGYYDANTRGTLNLLELCRRHGVAKFLLASTSSLYGARNPVPFREDADTSRPLSPYAASKKAAETIAYTYHYLHGIDVSVVRYFTVFGPAGRPDMSVFRFIRWIDQGEPVILFGDGSQSRDLTYIDDIARGTIAAMRPLGYEIINLGGDHPVTMTAVIEQLSALLGKPARLERRPPQAADVHRTWADVSKARALLSWTPSVSFEDGLRRSVEWFQTNRELVVQLDLGPA